MSQMGKWPTKVILPSLSIASRILRCLHQAPFRVPGPVRYLVPWQAQMQVERKIRGFEISSGEEEEDDKEAAEREGG